MGAGRSVQRHVGEDRWYECAQWIKDGPTHLDGKETIPLRMQWKAEKSRKVPGYVIMQDICDRYDAIDRTQSTYVCSVVCDDALTFEAAIRLVGLMAHGTEAEKKRLWFDVVDRDGSKSLDLEELTTVIKFMHPDLNEEYWKESAIQMMRCAKGRPYATFEGDGPANALSMKEWDQAYKHLCKKMANQRLAAQRSGDGKWFGGQGDPTASMSFGGSGSLASQSRLGGSAMGGSNIAAGAFAGGVATRAQLAQQSSLSRSLPPLSRTVTAPLPALQRHPTALGGQMQRAQDGAVLSAMQYGAQMMEETPQQREERAKNAELEDRSGRRNSPAGSPLRNTIGGRARSPTKMTKPKLKNFGSYEPTNDEGPWPGDAQQSYSPPRRSHTHQLGQSLSASQSAEKYKLSESIGREPTGNSALGSRELTNTSLRKHTSSLGTSLGPKHNSSLGTSLRR